MQGTEAFCENGACAVVTFRVATQENCPGCGQFPRMKNTSIGEELPRTYEHLVIEQVEDGGSATYFSACGKFWKPEDRGPVINAGRCPTCTAKAEEMSDFNGMIWSL